MRCPRCNHTMTRTSSPASDSQNTPPKYYCDNCGWGKDRPGNNHITDQHITDQTDAASSAGRWGKVIGLWVVSVALVIVPYMLLLKIPSLFGGADPAIFDAEAATARMADMLNPTYWIIAFTYILICATFNPPTVDWQNMGLFGTTINNPFTYSDNINRKKALILLLMLPGTIVVLTLKATYRVIRDAV